MNNPPRVALFTDCFHEVNGAAHSCRQLVQYAANHNLPFLSVHSGPRTETRREGSVLTLELLRSRTTLPIDIDFGCDLVLWRYATKVAKVLEEFQPDVVHVISPGDFSWLGAYLGHQLGVPVIGSYHTQLHQYAATRMRRSVAFLPPMLREPLANLAQNASFHGMTLFYRIPSVLLAPTPEICQWLGEATGRPCRLMGRGVDTVKFSPKWREVDDGVLRLGFVGRLTAEKNVRLLARIEQALIAQGRTNYRFVVVGEGSERAWLAEHMQRADLPGVLHGDALSRAYANFDVFVFPSHTDAFGNVVQEALASGVPAVVTTDGGPKFVIDEGITGFAAATEAEFIARVIELAEDPPLRRRMAAAALSATANRTWDEVMSIVYRYYGELCDSAAAEVARQAQPGRGSRFPRQKIKSLGYGTPVTKEQL